MTERYIMPGEANLVAFGALPDDEPIHMLNFLKYRDKAEYPADHEHAGKGWTGQRAYEEYIEQLGPIFDRIGARLVWRSSFQATTIGSPDEVWDDMLIAEYPTAKVFLEMVGDPEYQLVTINRAAALSDSRIFRTKPGT